MKELDAMPLSAKRRSGVGGSLRIPQVRVLEVLNAEAPAAMRRAVLSEHLGTSEISGTLGRALHGVLPGGVNAVHLGLLELGYVSREDLDIDGLRETVYQITDAGKAVLESLPEEVRRKARGELRERTLCINKRYRRPAPGEDSPPSAAEEIPL